MSLTGIVSVFESGVLVEALFDVSDESTTELLSTCGSGGVSFVLSVLPITLACPEEEEGSEVGTSTLLKSELLIFL